MNKSIVLLFAFVVALSGSKIASSDVNPKVDTNAQKFLAVTPVNQSVCSIIYIMQKPAPEPEDKLYVTLTRESTEGEESIIDDHHFESSEAWEGSVSNSIFAVPDLCVPSGELKYRLLLRREDETQPIEWDKETVTVEPSNELCTDTDDICDEALEIWQAEQDNDNDDEDDEETGCGC